jgi:RNA polymerase sigma-70 factor (ECF subfamily)
VPIAPSITERDEFAELVEPYRSELYVHCYRMLGSAQDAEDALQDALVRAWRGLPRFEGRSSLRSWLYAIATNAALRTIEQRSRRMLPVDYGPAADPHHDPDEPLTESVWIDPIADAAVDVEQREGIELAFIAALQHLPARQRAVLILRDVLGFSAKEAAAVLETTPPAIDSALQRAHATVDRRLPQRSQQATLRTLGDRAVRELVERFVAAWERNDVPGIVALLATDARMTMPPMPTWYRGRDAVAGFLARRPLKAGLRWRMLPTSANGQPCLACYLWEDEPGAFAAHSLNVLTFEGAKIVEITAFLGADSFERFGLPVVSP